MYLFLDTETTGIPTRWGAHYSELSVWPHIVSMSWAFGRSSVEVAAPFYAIVRPDGFVIPPETTRIHGISTEQAMRDGHPLHDVLFALQTRIETHQPTMLVAHNVGFDRPILLAEMLRAGISTQTLEHLPTYCTMVNSTNYCAMPGRRGGFKWPTLDELYRKLFNQPHAGAHDARADLIACARCFFQMQQLGIGTISKPSG